MSNFLIDSHLPFQGWLSFIQPTFTGFLLHAATGHLFSRDKSYQHSLGSHLFPHHSSYICKGKGEAERFPVPCGAGGRVDSDVLHMCLLSGSAASPELSHALQVDRSNVLSHPNARVLRARTCPFPRFAL